MTKEMIGRHVVVSTTRGMFFGVLEKRDGNEVLLGQCQSCVHWSTATRGFVGLAERGPQGGSRVGPPAEKAWINDVTSILLASEKAVSRWQDQPWS